MLFAERQTTVAPKDAALAARNRRRFNRDSPLVQPRGQPLHFEFSSGFTSVCVFSSPWRRRATESSSVHISALALLRKNLKGLTPELAEASYKVLLDPKTGLQRKAELNISGLRTVLALRSEYGQPQKKLTDPMKYYDPSYYKKALGN